VQQCGTIIHNDSVIDVESTDALGDEEL